MLELILKPSIVTFVLVCCIPNFFDAACCSPVLQLDIIRVLSYCRVQQKYMMIVLIHFKTGSR